MKDTIIIKLFFVGAIAVACFVASMLVLGLVAERESRLTEVATEVAASWGSAQTLMGPVLVFHDAVPEAEGRTRTRATYVLPETLTVEKVLVPEVRSRGIFDTVVYTETLHVRGSFRSADVGSASRDAVPTVVVALGDTRSIAEQVDLTWNDVAVPFAPGTSDSSLGEAGMHANVPFARMRERQDFAFTLTLRGSGEASVVPLGATTRVAASSSWPSPQFVGAFLPGERSLTPQGFTAAWQVSSFGRGYPSRWDSDAPVSRETLLASSFGVKLHEGVDMYTQVERAVKYAVLFILITFTVFFLFEVLTPLAIHPIQYLLVGASLALFYLLLLSFTEHMGFLVAYLLASVMTAGLITLYSARVLRARSRAGLVLGTLMALYGYLYFVLKLEDYALLFGALLVFTLLAVVMYATRNIDWFALGADTRG